MWTDYVPQIWQWCSLLTYHYLYGIGLIVVFLDPNMFSQVHQPLLGTCIRSPP
jgi:hypothetical protein